MSKSRALRGWWLAVVAGVCLSLVEPARAEIKLDGMLTASRRISPDLAACIINNHDVYVSDKTLCKWTRVHQGTKSPMASVLCGGDKQAVYFIEDTSPVGSPKSTQHLKVYLPGAKPTEVQDLGVVTTEQCDFISRARGASVEGANLRITIDGAKTWKPIRLDAAPQPASPKPVRISLLRWASEDTLYVGDSTGRVRRLAVDAQGQVVIKWTQAMPEARGVDSLHATSDAVWVQYGPFAVLDAKTGQIKESFRSRRFEKKHVMDYGFTVDGDTAYLYGDNGIERWKRGDKKTRLIHAATMVHAVFLQDKRVLVVEDNEWVPAQGERPVGGGARPKGKDQRLATIGRLDPAKGIIIPLEFGPDGLRDTVLDPDELKGLESEQLMKRLPEEKLDAILQAAMNNPDRERAPSLEEQLKRAVEEEEKNNP